MFLVWPEESNVHLLGCTTEFYRKKYLLGSQQKRELREAERTTWDVGLICINSSRDHAVVARITCKKKCDYQVMLQKMSEIKMIVFQNSNAALRFLGVNKMWINMSTRVLSISFAPCTLLHFGLFLIDLQFY